MKLTAYQISRIDKEIPLSNAQYIVMVDVMGDKNLANGSPEVKLNIYRIDNEYNIIWQVCDETKCTFSDGDPFCYLDKNVNGEIVAHRFSGFEYKIDPETGEAEQIGFHK